MNDTRLWFEYGIHVPTRTVWLGEGHSQRFHQHEIDDMDKLSAAHTIKSLLLLDSLGPEPINLRIQSEGGLEESGWAVYDTIKALNCPVHIYGVGAVCSIAAWILQAGTKRILYPNTVLMVHEGSRGIPKDKSKDVRDAWDRWYNHTSKEFTKILLDRIREKHPNFKRAQVLKMLATETIFSAAQAVQIGLADTIITQHAKSSNQMSISLNGSPDLLGRTKL